MPTPCIGKSEELWKKAIDGLRPETRDQLETSRTAKLDIVGSVLKLAEAKREITLKKRWTFKKANGDEIVVRDLLEKIISWIHRFQEIGDTVVQFSPQYAALPWAAIRFVLQATVSEQKAFGDLSEGLELITRLVVRFHEFETLFLLQPTDSHVRIEEALVRLYSAMLEYLAEAINFFRDSTPLRVLKAAFHRLDHQLWDRIVEREEEVLKLADLAQVRRLLAIETCIKRLSIRSDEGQKSIDKEQHSALLKWLSPVPYLKHHQSHQATRVPGTGSWLLQDSLYQTWASSSSSSLFLLYGILGSGKTKACSTIIDQYHRSSPSERLRMAPVAFSYCAQSTFEPERSSSVGVLRSLVRQLATKTLPKPSVHATLSSLYEEKGDEAEGFDLVGLSISECVKVILEVVEDNPAYLIIDAIDELEEPTQLLDALSEIQSRSRNVVKVFMTSRDKSSILAMMPQSALQFRIRKDTNAADVRNYAASEVARVKHNRKLLLGDIPPELEQKLVQSLCSGAGEMFLWIKLRVEELTQFKHEDDVRKALDTVRMPTVDDLFASTVARILNGGEAACNLATRAFAWLLYMREPVSPEVFRSAVSFEASVVQVEHLLSVCHNLIYLDTSMQVFRFAHYSVQQYLCEQPFLAVKFSQQILASTCLSVCNAGPSETTSIAAPNERLYDYAAMYWGCHCAALDVESFLMPLLNDLDQFLFVEDRFGPASLAWMDHVQTTRESLPYNHPEQIRYNAVITNEGSPLFPICVYGLPTLLQDHHWAAELDFNQQNKFGQTPLYLASFFGHREIVAHLLDRGVDVNVHCGKYGSPLHCSAFRGHVEITQMLLHEGADPSHGKWESVIHAAFAGGHEQLVLDLLKNDTQLETQARIDQLLRSAAEVGFELVMRWLLQHSLRKVEVPDQGLDILKKAIDSGKVSSVTLLRRHPKFTNALPQTSLTSSALHGHAEMVTYLIDQGMDISLEGELGSPLRCASLNGHSDVCRLLLARGADVDQEGSLGSPLHAACMKGHMHIVQLLIQNGANVNRKGGHYGVCVQAAAFQGHVEIVDILVRSGADLCLSGMYNNALCAALDGCSYAVVDYLANSGSKLIADPMSLAYPCGGASEPPQNILRSSSPKRQASRISRVRSPPAEQMDHHASLVAVGRTGHLDIIEHLIDEDTQSGGFYWKIEDVLLEAYRCGRSNIVRQLLSRAELDRRVIRKMLKAAAIMNDRETIDEVLRHVSGLVPDISRQEDPVLLSLPSLTIFETLLSDFALCSTERELQTLLRNCLWIAAGEGHIQTLTDGLLRRHPYQVTDLTLALEYACARGQDSVIPVLYQYLPRDDRTTKIIIDCIWRALVQSNSKIAILLFDYSLERGANAHIQRLILHAARSGYQEFLEVCFDRRIIDLQDTCQLALNIAARHGNAAICQLLIANGASPTRNSKAPSSHYAKLKALHRPKEMIEVHYVGWNIFHKYSIKQFDGQAQDQISPIESCLQGSWKQQSDTDNLVRTMHVLLESSDHVPEAVFARAVAICPIETIRSFVEKTANIDAVPGSSSIAEIAARREHLQYRIINLVLFGKDLSALPRPLAARILEHSLDNFKESEEGEFFTETPLLSDVFSTGPGATISALLRDYDLTLPNDASTALYLQCAVAAGETEIVKTILQHAVDVNTICGYYGTALQAASHRGSSELAGMLIEAGADPDIIGGRFRTALQAAVIGGHRQIVDILLTGGATVDLCGPAHQIEMVPRKRRYFHSAPSPPLILAINSGYVEIAFELLRAGADPNFSPEHETYALIDACKASNTQLLMALLERGADVQVSQPRMELEYANPLSSHGIRIRKLEDGSALHQAIATENLDAVRILLKHGFDLSVGVYGALPPLVLAVDTDCYPIIDVLLDTLQDATIDELSTALQHAVLNGNLIVVKRLLSRGAQMCHSPNNANCLTIACTHSKLEVLEYLLERLAQTGNLVQVCNEVMRNCSIKDPKPFQIMLEYVTCSPDLFVYACMRGWCDVVQTAIAQGIDINTEDSKGRLGLHFAAAFGRADIVRHLLVNGANPNQTSQKLGTALATALESFATKKLLRRYNRKSRDIPREICSHLEFLSGLEEQGVSWSTKYTYFRDHADISQTGRMIEIVSLLLSWHVDPRFSSEPFGYLEHTAAFYGHVGIFESLTHGKYDLSLVGGFFENTLAAAINGNSVEIVQRLVQSIAPSEDSEAIFGNALITACQALSPRAVKILLDLGVRADFPALSGNTPFNALMSYLSSNFSRNEEDVGLILNLLLHAPSPLKLSQLDVSRLSEEFLDQRQLDQILTKLFAQFPDLEMPATAVT